MSEDIIQKTGYVFGILEPLFSLGSKTDGGKTFDIAIINKKDKRLLLIEAKSTVSFKGGKTALNALKDKVDFAEENFDTLKKELGIPELKWEDVEFVIAIAKGSGVDGIVSSIAAQLSSLKSEKKKDSATVSMLGRTVIWSILKFQDDRCLILERKSNEHKSVALNKILKEGISQSKIKNRFDVPFLLSDHSWIILFKSVAYLIDKNFSDPSIIDKKKIPIAEMENYVAKVVSVGATEISNLQSQRAKEAVARAIKNGVEHGVISSDGETIRIECRGRKKRSILKCFENKYVGEDFEKSAGAWAIKQAEANAKKLALEDFDKRGSVTLDYFND